MALAQLVRIRNQKVRHPQAVLAREEEKPSPAACQFLYKNQEGNFCSVDHDVIIPLKAGLQPENLFLVIAEHSDIFKAGTPRKATL